MRRSLVSRAVLLAACLLVFSPARAQTPSAEAMEAARELVAAAQLTKQFKVLLPMVIQQLKSAIVQGRPEVERDYDKLMPVFSELAEKRLAEFVEATATIYATHFSPQELRDIAAFYRTPSGQKALEKLPLVTQEGMLMGQKFGNAIGKELQAKSIEELRKRGHNI